MEKEQKKKSHYISNKEIREISKENSKIMKHYERRKRRKNVDPSEYLTTMKNEDNVIEIDNLHTYFFTDAGVVKAVNGVSFDIPANSIVGVVGESGCGKSVTSYSLMQLIQAPQGQIVEGSIRFKTNNETYDIAKLPTEEMRKIRGKEISMIFQEPMTSLNPVFTIGEQIDEVTMLHVEGATKESAKARSIELLELVGIAMAEQVYQNYPHQLSGGMRQRVIIAIALACNPKVIVADEPTTALDVTIQAQILELLKDLKTKLNGSIILITHDLGVIANMVDYVVVMYAGKVIEKGTVREIFKNPMHPYTIGLQKSKPVVNQQVDRLYSIPGQVPNPINLPNFCYFKDRCERCIAKCNGDYPNMIKVSDTHYVSCHLYEESDEVK